MDEREILYNDFASFIVKVRWLATDLSLTHSGRLLSLNEDSLPLMVSCVSSWQFRVARSHFPTKCDHVTLFTTPCTHTLIYAFMFECMC